MKKTLLPLALTPPAPYQQHANPAATAATTAAVPKPKPGIVPGTLWGLTFGQ